MIRPIASLIVLGLACSGCSSHAAAQDTMGLNMGSIPGGMGLEMAQNSPFVSHGAIPLHNVQPHSHPPGFPNSPVGAPVIVLPMPPINSMSGINSPHGFQFPGSYIPQGTPLHRYNGYVVCNPPDLAAGATAGATGATPQRIVKITSTRSPSAPSHPQPCPVYTINGEIQQPKSYTTTITPSYETHPHDRERPVSNKQGTK